MLNTMKEAAMAMVVNMEDTILVQISVDTMVASKDTAVEILEDIAAVILAVTNTVNTKVVVAVTQANMVEFRMVTSNTNI